MEQVDRAKNQDVKEAAILMIIVLVLFLTQLISCDPAFSAERNYNKAVIHHTDSGCSTTIEDIRRWHVDENGWDDVGYHLVIACDGSILPGRDYYKKGAHARGRNHWAGIALIGKESFTDAQITTLLMLLPALHITEAEGHHEQCPGPGIDAGLWKLINHVVSEQRRFPK